jgi:hypothetical protein
MADPTDAPQPTTVPRKESNGMIALRLLKLLDASRLAEDATWSAPWGEMGLGL